MQLAEAALEDGTALHVFFKMIEAQGGDTSVFDDPQAFHKPGATEVLERLGDRLHRRNGHHPSSAGPCSAPAQAAKRQASPSIRTPESSSMRAAAQASKKASRSPPSTPPAKQMLAEPIALLERRPSPFPRPHRPPSRLVGRIFTRENAEADLRDAVR
jgi:hypothetical protein